MTSQSMLRSSIAAFLVALCSASHDASAQAPSTDWVQQSPPSSPTPRGAPAMTYDDARHELVLFGGFLAAGYSNETWTYDGTTWTLRTPPVSPPARAAATLAYDAPTQKAILFGGFSGSSYLGDTWVWDGTAGTWTQNSSSPSPSPVTGPMSFADPINAHVTVFGGYNGMFYQLTTWQWSGTGWTQLQPATSPYARSAGVAVVDPPHGRVVLFGGLGSVNPNNTWLWDGTNWQMASPNHQPLLRYDSGGAFDPALGHPILFGGGSGGVDQQDTWEWTGADWVQLQTLHAPPARESFGIAYDAGVGHIVLFGGDNNGSPLFSDTWWFAVLGSGTPFCLGDGSGTACPCGNSSPVGNDAGCLNSLGTGGRLAATGVPSVSNDSLALQGSGMPSSSALYFQGTAQLNGGAGVVFGDGLRCAGGSVLRLGIESNVNGNSQYPSAGDPSVSVRGQVTAPGARSYQIWYRNSASFCTPQAFNLSNGYQVTWGP